MTPEAKARYEAYKAAAKKDFGEEEAERLDALDESRAKTAALQSKLEYSPPETIMVSVATWNSVMSTLNDFNQICAIYEKYDIQQGISIDLIAGFLWRINAAIKETK